jgi:hypothetical protein
MCLSFVTVACIFTGDRVVNVASVNEPFLLRLNRMGAEAQVFWHSVS